MPTEPNQVLGARLQSGKQVEAGNAASRASPTTLTIKRDHQDGPVVALDQARGDDPDHPGVPALTGDDEATSVSQVLGQRLQRRLRLIGNLALSGPPLAVGPVQLGGYLTSAILIAVRKSSTPASAR